MKIILISGYAGSGKDTLGQHLVTRYGWSRFAFADLLKDELSALEGWDRSLLDTHSGKDETFVEGVSIRSRLIAYAEDAKMKHGSDYWARRLIDRIKVDNVDKVVVTDWRSLAEHDAFKSEPGWSIETWRVNRWTTSFVDHPLEYELDNFPFSLLVPPDQMERIAHQLPPPLPTI